MSDPIHYCLGFGFMFQPSAYDCTILVRKSKPAWQRGKLNGVGGKVESGELVVEAMAREFTEETQLPTTPKEWTRFAVMLCGDCTIHCFYGCLGGRSIYNAQGTDQEPVVIANLAELRVHKVLSNVPWLMEMAIESFRNKELPIRQIHY